MAQKQKSGPDTTSAAYEAMLPLWVKLSTVMGGTEAMRAAGKELLPQHEEESDRAYTERLARTTLLNFLAMTVDSWVGKPFSEPIKIGDDVPASISQYMDNVDLQGNNLDVFCRNWFRDGVVKGFSHVLVDFSRPNEEIDGQARTLADDRAEKLRPYLVHILPENIFFGHAQVVDGVEQVTHVRIKETIIEQEGWGEKVVNHIRVLEPGLGRVFEERIDPKTRKPIWVLIDQYVYDLDYVPVHTFYADRQGFMSSKPPLTDLADLNVRHWQSTSDQIAVLTVARFPILGVSGAISDDKLTIGPNQWLHVPDPAGRFYYVEHSGKAISAGRQDILDLEEVMAEYGATFLKKRPGGASATARALDTAETTSPLQDMVIRFQGALTSAMKTFGRWLGETEIGTFTLDTDFDQNEFNQAASDALGVARENQDISRNRYLKELHRMGVLGEDFDAETNDTELKAEQTEALALLKKQIALQPSPAGVPAPGKPAGKVKPTNPKSGSSDPGGGN